MSSVLTIDTVKNIYSTIFKNIDNNNYVLHVISVSTNPIINLSKLFYKHRLMDNLHECDEGNVTEYFNKIKSIKWLRLLNCVKNICVVTDNENKVSYIFYTTSKMNTTKLLTNAPDFECHYSSFLHQVNKYEESIITFIQSVYKTTYENIENVVNDILTNPENTFIISGCTHHDHNSLTWLEDLSFVVLKKYNKELPSEIINIVKKTKTYFKEQMKMVTMKAIMSQFKNELDYIPNEHAFRIMVTKITNNTTPFVLVYTHDSYELQNEIQQMKDDHAKEIQKLKEEHAKEIQQLKGEIQQLKEEHAREMQELKDHMDEIIKTKVQQMVEQMLAGIEQRHIDEMNIQQKQHKQAMAKKDEYYTSKIVENDKKHKQEMADMEVHHAKQHKQEIENIEKKHANDIKEIKKHDAANFVTQINKLKEKHAKELQECSIKVQMVDKDKFDKILQHNGQILHNVIEENKKLKQEITELKQQHQ